MGIFQGHRLIRQDDGVVLVLYLDLRTEFARDLGSLGEVREEPFRKHIQAYIARNLPALRIKAVHLVAGSLLVASVALIPGDPTITVGIGEYRVQPGDTLPRIAEEFQTSVAQLKQVNHLQEDELREGQSLRLPFGASLPEGSMGRGDRGEGVKTLQQALVWMGYPLPVDGRYGPRTAEIILQLQKKKPGIQADGVYGPETRGILEELLSSGYRIVSNPRDRLVLVNKTNSLSHDYIPPDLVVPDVPFTIQGDAPRKYMRKEAAQALEGLFRQAREEGVDLRGVSGYRSYEYQAQLFAANLARNPNANQTSARPGESEHQTGWAMDVSGPSVQYGLVPAFGDTREGRWLARNAPGHGFVIRYPKGKEGITGYRYEPWHLRYVGKETALRLTGQGITLEEDRLGGLGKQ